jgi:hypothetical protein
MAVVIMTIDIVASRGVQRHRELQNAFIRGILY